MDMRLSIVSILFLLTSCDAADTSPLMDTDAHADAESSDFFVLPDAVLLEQGIITDVDADESETIWNDLLLDFSLSPQDIFEPWRPEVMPPFDASLDHGGIGCGPKECQPGEACIDISGSGLFDCVPVTDCSPDGALVLHDLDDVETLLKQLFFVGHVYLKIETKVFMGPPTCGFVACPPENPCCNECVSRLFAGVEDMGIVLNGNGIPIGCKGSDCQLGKGCKENCDFTKLCSPLIPGKYYWIWGELVVLAGVAEFRVDGFCLAH